MTHVRGTLRRQQAAALNALFFIAALAVLLAVPDERVLIAPALCLCAVALWFLTTLWVREAAPPVFECGTLWMLATAVYGTIPMLGFAMMHGQWTPDVDGRLLWYDFDRSELAHLGWDYVIYTVSFVVIYLVARGRRPLRMPPLRRPSPAAIIAILLVLGMVEAVTIGLRVVYGYDAQAGYAQLEQIVAGAQRVPHVIMQFSNVIMSSKLVAEQAILALVFVSWRRWRYRFALIVWLGAEIATLLVRLGSRGPLMLLILSAGVLYHRLVRPVTFRMFIAAGLVLLSAFLGIGLLRSIDTAPQVAARPNVLTSMNEFQALFATAFDIHKRKELRILGDVPWQLYAVDLYLLIPRQLLPFEKIDPSQWYLEESGLAGSGTGYMFGVMAEAVLGLGRIELVARGAVLGLLLGLLHRWYVKHASSFWATILYVFVSIWTYYTFRATTFWFVYFVVYQFIPVVVFVKLMEFLLLKVRPRAVVPAAPPLPNGAAS